MGASAGPGKWYLSLNKPTWNPPSWVFAPVWTTLYILMAVAAWMIWKRGGLREQRRPLGMFLLQLALNAAWTPIFFGLHQIGWAFVVILFLWLAILLTILAFRSRNEIAAWLLVPYLAWVTFASILNFAIWELNR